MRLIQTRASGIKLIEVDEQKIRNKEIRYAILSHRWGDDEISFQDVNPSTGWRRSTAEYARWQRTRKTAGYRKIKAFCHKAASEYEYGWVDTCCINKDSSAELSEAINSMYRWYQLAGICYVYLNDVPFSTDKSQLEAGLEQSVWFTRGWTLQELIAPSNVVFLAADWREVGSKKEFGGLICRITRIDESILCGEVPLHTVSVAKRMSWAAARTTCRVEDIAYCLMGLFDVNMPLLYGEGERAFFRLQDEIMKDSDDQTIFAWEDQDIDPHRPSGLLARSPANFLSCMAMTPYSHAGGSVPFEVSKRGIRLCQFFLGGHESTGPGTLSGTTTIMLNCRDDTRYPDFTFGIRLCRSEHNDCFVRVAPTLDRTLSWTHLHSAKYDTIYAAKRLPQTIENYSLGRYLVYKEQELRWRNRRNIIVLLDCVGSKLIGPFNSDGNPRRVHPLSYPIQHLSSAMQLR